MNSSLNKQIIINKPYDLKMENIDKILNAFKQEGKPLRSGEIADLVGLDKKEIDKLLKVLKTEGKIFSPRRCFYDLKD